MSEPCIDCVRATLGPWHLFTANCQGCAARAMELLQSAQLDAERFARLTGWQGRTNEHGKWQIAISKAETIGGFVRVTVETQP